MKTQLNATELLLATAQVFEDHPQTFTTGAYGRTRDGRDVSPEHPEAVCFCLVGAIRRIDAEGGALPGAAKIAIGRMRQKASFSPESENNRGINNAIRFVRAVAGASRT